MLIQFVSENFRSLKKEQTLSLIRSSGNEMPNNFFQTTVAATPELLKSAIVYGTNASDKSNVIKALGSMLHIIQNSSSKKINRPIETESFLFDALSHSEPTLYDISIIVPLTNEEDSLQEVQVGYGFVADKNMVYEEWLSAYPKGKERNRFHREYKQEKSDYDWKMSICFEEERGSWKNQTRPDRLFFSSVVHLNSEQLKLIYESLSEGILIVRTDRISNELSKSLYKNSDKEKTILISLLKFAGIKVDDITFRKPKVRHRDFPKELPGIVKDKIPKEIEKAIVTKTETFLVYFDGTDNPPGVPLHEESDGTQKLFEFTGLILAVLHNGNVLIIDELNKSLHPDLVRFLVKLFNSLLNKKNAQLIFTTHETSALRKDLLHRDQVWFCEKEEDRGTHLYPLTNLKPHINHEDIEEYHLHGRYGAKPMISNFELPKDFWESK